MFYTKILIGYVKFKATNKKIIDPKAILHYYCKVCMLLPLITAKTLDYSWTKYRLYIRRRRRFFIYIPTFYHQVDEASVKISLRKYFWKSVLKLTNHATPKHSPHRSHCPTPRVKTPLPDKYMQFITFTDLHTLCEDTTCWS